MLGTKPIPAGTTVILSIQARPFSPAAQFLSLSSSSKRSSAQARSGAPRAASQLHSLANCAQGVHHRADLWPEPLKFDPTRFLRDDGKDHDDPYAYLPFIQGPRNCLGQHLALLEARLVLGTICKARTPAESSCRWAYASTCLPVSLTRWSRPPPPAALLVQVRAPGRRGDRHEDDPDRAGAPHGDDRGVSERRQGAGGGGGE